jgi:hypothetical protein
MPHDNPMTTLRHICPFGPCIVLGKLARETKRYYFYIIRDNRHARIPKSAPAVHLDPCRKCRERSAPS